MSSIQVYDRQGKKLETLSFGLSDTQEVNNALCSQAVHVLLQNWRQGTVGCKARGDVSFSNHKPWRQKGTGQARAQSARSPLWRGGGVTFGPQARVRKLSLNAKQRQAALRDVFQSYAANDNILCLDFEITDGKPSTKQAFEVLKGVGLDLGAAVLFVASDDALHSLTFRNLSNISILSFDQPNVYDCLNAPKWVFLKKDIELFKRMVERWN
jgi:large subunit ribosomal protein L4